MTQDIGPNKVLRKLAAIMFTDIVGYSRMMGQNEDETFQLLEEYDNLVSPIIKSHNGSILKKLGDGMFCEFSSAVNAVECALAIQNTLYEYNKSSTGPYQLMIRIGIHVGDVIKKEDDLFGDGVNVAARIETLAPPGGIYISDSVHSAVSSHPRFVIKELGLHSLKNISKEHNLYQLVTGHESVQNNVKNSRSVKSTKSPKTDTTVISQRQKFFSQRKFAVVITIVILLSIAITFNQQILGILGYDYQTSVSELATNSSNPDEISEDLIKEIRDILSSEQSQKLISEISSLKTSPALLEYLQKSRDAGWLTFGLRDDFFKPQGKYIIILDEHKVYTLLYYYRNVYYDIYDKQTYTDLSQNFKGKRNIWIELL